MEKPTSFPKLATADALTVAKYACRVLVQKLASGVKLISAQGSALTDYFVVGYAGTATHARALAGYVTDALAAAGVDVRRVEGTDTSEWVLIDCSDVIVHIFRKSAGEFYNFERLFKAEAFVEIDDLTADTEQV